MNTRDFRQDAKLLREALYSEQLDEDAIIQLTNKRSNSERQKIKFCYKSIFESDFLEDLESKYNGNLKNILIGMYLSPLEFDVKEINYILNNPESNIDVLSEIIGSRSNYRLLEIKNIYLEKYQENLEDKIHTYTLNEYNKFLISILKCNKDISQYVYIEEVEQDAKDLKAAIEEKFSTNQEVLHRIFSLRNSQHLKSLNLEYKNISGKSLAEYIESDFSGNLKYFLKTILHSNIETTDYYAERIYKSCKDSGDSDPVLITALISMNENLINEIKKIYKIKYGMTIFEHLEKESNKIYKIILTLLLRL